MKACLVNYNYDPEDWWLDYGFKPEDIVLYDRSDDGKERKFKAGKILKTENRGNVDADKLAYIIENFYDLPEVFLWAKTNIWKYTTPEILHAVIDKGEFAVITKDHVGAADQFGRVSYMQDGLYWERNDHVGWYTTVLNHNMNWGDWEHEFALPRVPYIPFGPGGSMVLTRERVHKFGVDYYQRMRDLLMYSSNPAEAHMAERSYYLLWQ